MAEGWHGGDYDYNAHGVGYAALRQTDPRIAAQIHAALGDARTVLNVGAGAGSYEPTDRYVLAIEPSATMRAQRPPGAAPALNGVVEQLPLDDQAVDASLALLTLHQWSDWHVGLRELQRVTRGPIVIMTFDREELHRFWLADYVPEFLEAEAARFPPISEITAAFRPAARVVQIPIPADCRDGFTEAFFARPERFLDDAVRRAQSAWRFVESGVEARFVAALRADLTSGAWERRYGDWRRRPTYHGALRLIIGHGGPG